MNEEPDKAAEASPDEISALISRLIETEQRLLELTQGQVDAILDPGGRSYLLRQAQEKLRQSEATQRKLAKTQTSILDALPANIALVDSHGVILSVNEGWRRFAVAGAVLNPISVVGQNYLEVCERAEGEVAGDSHRVAAGIRSVLAAGVKKFEFEYPCHTPSEKRWFRLLVAPLENSGGAVVMHLNITERKLMEFELQRSASRQTSLFENMMEGYCYCRLLYEQGRPCDYVYLEVNKAFEAQTGLKNVVGKKVSEVVPGMHEANPEQVELYHRVAFTGKAERFETYARLLKIWFSVSVYSQEKEHFVAVFNNITERKKVDEELRWKTAFLEAQVGSSLDGILVVDEKGRKILQNQQTSDLMKIPPHIAEDPDDEKQRSWVTGIMKNPKQFAEKVSYLNSHRDEISRDEIELKDGTVLERYSSPVKGQDQRYYGRVWTFRDITDRKRTEARFRRLVDSNAQGIIFWNTKGEISDANDAFLNLTRYTREDLKTGRINWAKMTPPEYAGLDQRALKELATKGVCAPYEKEWVRKDFSRVSVLLGAAMFEDNQQEGICFIVDLTERKQLEQQLLRTQRMESIGTLAGGIAHDLNNILSPILMSSSLLRRAQSLKAVEEIIPMIEGSARRGADVVRQLLIFGRGAESERVLTQVKHLLKDMAKMVRETFPKNITFKSKIPNDLWPVLGDATQIHQVILNLCVNARDAMPDGGSLFMGATNVELDADYARTNPEVQSGKYLKLEVADSGTGIAPEVIGKIFDPFFTTKPVGKGTGLGLSTVLGIVKNHGGFITIHSELGKGSRFEVHLPASADAVVRDLDAPATTSVAKRGQGELVLVVDDEARILSATRRILEAHGYQVLTATDGIDALAVFAKEKEKINLVLTDLLMPLLDGFSLVRTLKKMEPGVKIIVTSGISADGKWQAKIAELESLGLSGVLAKPFQPDALLELLHETLHEIA